MSVLFSLFSLQEDGISFRSTFSGNVTSISVKYADSPLFSTLISNGNEYFEPITNLFSALRTNELKYRYINSVSLLFITHSKPTNKPETFKSDVHTLSSPQSKAKGTPSLCSACDKVGCTIGHILQNLSLFCIV